MNSVLDFHQWASTTNVKRREQPDEAVTSNKMIWNKVSGSEHRVNPRHLVRSQTLNSRGGQNRHISFRANFRLTTLYSNARRTRKGSRRNVVREESLRSTEVANDGLLHLEKTEANSKVRKRSNSTFEMGIRRSETFDENPVFWTVSFRHKKKFIPTINDSTFYWSSLDWVNIYEYATNPKATFRLFVLKMKSKPILVLLALFGQISSFDKTKDVEGLTLVGGGGEGLADSVNFRVRRNYLGVSTTTVQGRGCGVIFRWRILHEKSPMNQSR